MTYTSKIIKVGNSSGVIIPSALFKALKLSDRDPITLREAEGGIILKKAEAPKEETPFSALDRWYEENGYPGDAGLDDALAYVSSIRNARHDKPIPQW